MKQCMHGAVCGTARHEGPWELVDGGGWAASAGEELRRKAGNSDEKVCSYLVAEEWPCLPWATLVLVSLNVHLASVSGTQAWVPAQGQA